ncbi:hypothetical protein swp_0942 [Shewanella piezotolerans WP3]|uniref:Rap1a immunity protein domain-containing protein n=1 Tax=Shewanella piezotolerans (strain WP3 / JCM 13877) TaxID=225849 RepID=B8CK44_SHEPW|nr:hypothetical protein [Shewanella piezotolerans]ACJ27747.1 hypothetical protein swp_0942 [Shewanella piezotolerans WP3]
MKNSLLLALLTLALTMTLSFSVFSASKTPAEEEQVVLDSCMSLENTPASSCIHYVQGFLAGSLAPKSDYVLRETSGEFFDRAYQTRVGKRTSKEQPVQLCLPKNKNVELIAKRLVGHLSYPLESMQLLHTQIFNALEAEYSCL